MTWSSSRSQSASSASWSSSSRDESKLITHSLNQLPYLDSKHEYLWGSRVVEEIADRSVPVLRADKVHTVRSLTGRMLELARGGLADTGFPVLVREHGAAAGRRGDEGHGHGHGGNGKERERDRGGMRVIGFLGTNELEHALGGSFRPRPSLSTPTS